MATWPVDVPQSNGLESADPRDDLAPAANAGMPFGDITNRAIAEEGNRKRLRLENTGIVTPAEVRESRLRRVALETCEAQARHGMGHGAILAAIQGVKADLQGVKADLQGVKADLQEVRADLQAVQATTRNGRRRELIRNGVWTPILVERAGPNPVGEVPPSHPASYELAIAMTDTQITTLERDFNLEPGTFNGATIAARREAVLRYLREG